MDFTVNRYEQLLAALQSNDYSFQTFKDFVAAPHEKSIVLRHDVDLLPHHSLRFAKLQTKAGVFGTYYFRAVPDSWDEKVILEIAEMGHEVGYHYETMDTANGNVDLGWDQFRHHLAELRKLTDVTTICMHGSPRSSFDNKDLWKKYDYRSLDLIGEPYYDVDFDKVFYLTDTGRRWDGWKVSVRDKVSQQDEWISQGLIYKNTNDIIAGAKMDQLPEKIMFTFHPQRWHSNSLTWAKEWMVQVLKNQVKAVLVQRRSK